MSRTTITSNKAKRLPTNFETLIVAKARRAASRRTLRNGGTAARLVAKRLAKCRKGRRCKSEACSVCLRLHRRTTLPKLVSFVAAGVAAGNAFTRVSVVPEKWTYPVGKLHRIDLGAEIKRLRKAIERSPLKRFDMVGAIDVSLNAEFNDHAYWQVHLYLLVGCKNTKRFRAQIRDLFPGEPTAPRPHCFKQVTKPIGAVSYAYKSIFTKRSRYCSNGKLQTGKQRIRGEALRELLCWLGDNRVGARWLLRGVSRQGKPVQRRKKAVTVLPSVP